MATLPLDLGDGLVLRRGTVQDGEALANFNALAFGNRQTGEPSVYVSAWTRELVGGRHPTVSPADFTLVEDTRSGAIVSSLCLISQTWSYGGTPFGVGRIELVATHPDYRRRGLIRAQMQVVHGWSAERGEMVQAIAGIPWYYRQFGYEMALFLVDRRVGYSVQVPQLKQGEEEPFPVRAATPADLPFVVRMEKLEAQRNLVSCLRSEPLWQYELERNEQSIIRGELRIIENADGRPVGALMHQARLWNPYLNAYFYEIEPGMPWNRVTPSVVRYLKEVGRQYAERDGKEFNGYGFSLGEQHPAYQAVPELLPGTPPSYTWYVRVPDVAAMIRHVGPVLEKRLAASVAAGYSGELKISFYRSGVRLVLKQGRLDAVEAWTPEYIEDGDAGFPELTFLQLLFGYRSIEELRYAFPDCRVARAEVQLLLDALFSKQASNVRGWA